MRYYQTIFVASALFSGLVSRVSGQATNTTYNIEAQILALHTNITPASLLNETSNQFNTSLFIDAAVLAIGTTFNNLVTENDAGLLLCENTGDNNTQPNGAHCHNSDNSGSLLADIIYDIAESDDALAAFQGDPIFMKSINQLFVNVTEQLIEANSTASCVRIVNGTSPVFTAAVVLVQQTKQIFPQVLVELGGSVFPTTNVSYIWESCIELDYESYAEDVNTATSEASKISEESILLQLAQDAELRESVKEFLSLFKLL